MSLQTKLRSPLIRHATLADFQEIIGEPLPFRVRAFAVEHDGKLLGIGGLAYLPNGTVGAFVHATEGARPYRIAMHKAGLRTMEEARKLGLRRVVALAEPGIEPAVRWLERLGFHPTVVDGETVYAWQG